MRIDPVFTIQKAKERDEDLKLKTRKITRILAIAVAFAVTFGLFVKILFF